MEQTELENIVMDLKDKIDNILNTVNESEKKYQHDVGVKGFTERNGESLGKYVDKLKKLNGDDFDLYSSAYDEYICFPSSFLSAPKIYVDTVTHKGIFVPAQVAYASTQCPVSLLLNLKYPSFSPTVEG